MKRIFLIIAYLASLVYISGCGHLHTNGELEFDKEHHWYSCKEQGCTERLEPEEHIWSQGEEVLDKTTGKTELVYKCKFCSAKKKAPYEPSEKTTVTKQEWEKAFDSANLKNVTATISEIHFSDGKEYTTEYQIQASSTVFYIIETRQENGEEVYYSGKFQDGNYQWIFKSREEIIEEAEYRIVDASEIISNMNIFKNYGVDLSKDFDSFTYNGDTKSYEGKYVGLEFGDERYESVSVKIGYGKIFEILAKGKNDKSIVKITLSSYGSTDPTPPQKKNG